MQRRLEQAVQHRTSLRARDFPRFTDLSLDLRFTEDHRIESGRDAIQVANGLAIADDISVFSNSTGRRRRQALPEQRPNGLERGFLFADEIELGPIARREQDSTPRARRHYARQGAGDLVRAMRKPLAHVEWCGAVVDAEDFDAHAAVVAHRNRSTPGWASFSAT